MLNIVAFPGIECDLEGNWEAFVAIDHKTLWTVWGIIFVELSRPIIVLEGHLLSTCKVQCSRCIPYVVANSSVEQSLRLNHVSR